MQSSSRPARKRGKHRGSAVGQGAAALIVATGLVGTAASTAHAAPLPASSAPGVSVAGSETDTPALVSGLNERTEGASAAAAARGHLAAKPGRYHIDNPGKNLEAIGTETDGAKETVRLEQKYQGVPVFGGTYLVRMEKRGGERVVTGTSGKYFTELNLDSVTPKVSEKVAIERAIAAVADQPGGLLRKDSIETAKAFTGKVNGLTVLPQGKGLLTRHVTVTGVGADGMPVKQEVYVDAEAGFPVLQYSSIKTTVGTSGTAAGTSGEAAETGEAPEVTATTTPGAVTGTGVRYNGETVELNLYQTGTKPYQMLDYSKRAADSPFQGQLIKTYDANGADAAYASGRWPSQATIGESDTAEFGQEFTDAGMVDAHWAAGKVYDYFKSNFDRAGLDGTDQFINSIVGVTANGGPFPNAFWDGQKMVYGKGGGDYRTFSADADVVGHEMSHGVIEHTANLVYVGQSGAMNEAIADYFGNAIDLETSKMSMDDPDAGLLGEDLCITAAPRDCALRDLNDGATTYDDFIGVTYGGDNGGVHLNSTIFSGALWDIREQLGTELADQIVYRALSAYMTPLDDFMAGRAAVVAAATELGATKVQLAVVKNAFAEHGIETGWEDRLGVDSDTLITDNNIAGTGVGAGGGKYAVSRTNQDGSEPYSVWLGNTNGKGQPELVSGNNGSYNVYADTDGKSVVWAEYTGSNILTKVRPVAGGITKTVNFSHNGPVGSLAVDGDLAVRTVTDYTTGTQHVGWLNLKTGASGLVDPGTPAVSTALPSVKDGKIAYAKLWMVPEGYRLGVEVFDTVAGTKTLMPMDNTKVMGIGQTAITEDGVVWIEDNDISDAGQAAVRKAGFDGSNPVTLTPEAGTGALSAYTLTASDDAVTVTDIPFATWYANETLPKLFQVSLDGTSGPKRMSCSRGEQMYAAADEGKRVLWFDGTTSHTNLVKRDRPAGRC
ncbi:M4 family metallopeptidase [Nocardioides sp. NPDC059952]|uniref:M4 family metallopeptidase n=1 Tax=Nocardioides sp. NPDC059952 TaxID=3347014 RepID=UPI00364EEC6C